MGRDNHNVRDSRLRGNDEEISANDTQCGVSSTRRRGYLALSWALFAVFLLWYFTWYSTHARYIPLEVGATLYDAWAAQFGLAHIPFYATIRPGFLINTPLMMLGIGPLGLNIFFQLFVCLTPFLLIGALRPALLKHPVAPWLSLLGYPIASRLFDYESVPVVFCVIALALFLISERHDNFKKMSLVFLSALCLSWASFSNFGVMGVGIFIALVYCLVLRHRFVFLWFTLTLIFTAACFYFYYIDAGVLHRVLSLAQRAQTHAAQLGQLQVLSAISIAFLMGVMIGVAINYLICDWGLPKRKYFDRIWLTCVLWVFVALTLLDLLTSASIWIDAVQMIFLVLFLFGLFRVGRGSFKRLDALFFIGVIMMMLAHRITSNNNHIFMQFYFPCLVLASAVLIFAHLKALRFYLLPWLYASSLLVFVSSIVNCQPGLRLFARVIAPAATNQLPSFMGKETTPSLSIMLSKVDRLYNQYHCQSKPLLVIAYPGLYYKYQRLAPFDTPWISREKIIPHNGLLTDVYLSNWLKSQNHWCVIDTSTMAHRTDNQLLAYLSGLRASIARSASVSHYLGYEYWDGKNWHFYVKE